MICNETCNKRLSCGHTCRGPCSKDRLCSCPCGATVVIVEENAGEDTDEFVPLAPPNFEPDDIVISNEKDHAELIKNYRLVIAYCLSLIGATAYVLLAASPLVARYFGFFCCGVFSLIANNRMVS